MISTRSTNPMKHGSVVTLNQPHTLLKINDNSAVDIPEVPSFPFNGIIVQYSPKGVTNTWMHFNGNKSLINHSKMFGNPNTNLYGNAWTYARRVLQGGFGLTVLNVAPPDARHANFYVSYGITPAKNELTGLAEQTILYAYKDAAGFHWFGFDAASLNVPVGDEANIKEISIPKMKVGFESRYIQDVDLEYDPEDFLINTDTKLLTPADGDLSKYDINVPVFGLFYEGANHDGNNYSFKVKDTNILINEQYPYYTGTVEYAGEEEFEYNFTLFDVLHEGLSTNFKVNSNKKCVMNTAPKRNVKIMRPYMVGRKVANKLKAITATLVTNLSDKILTEVKLAYPGFDETNTAIHNLTAILAQTASYADYFKTSDTDYGRAVETPFSRVTPWTTISSTGFIEHEVAPTEIRFEGGSSGKLKEMLDEEEFDWNLKYENPVDGTKYSIFEDLYIKAFNGTLDAAVYDPALVPHGKIILDGAPLEVYKAAEYLCRDIKDVVYSESIRSDINVWYAPPSNIRTFEAFNDYYERLEAHDAKMYNTNMKIFVGRGWFEDETTGGQSEFALFYDYFGPNSILATWLTSGISNSFASDDWSNIVGIIDGTESMIPFNSDEREVLTNKDVNYFGYKSDLVLALAEDTALYKGKLSALKNVTTTDHFNRIASLCYLIARDNTITEASDDKINKIIRKMLAVAPESIAHFKGAFKITAAVSTNELEVNKKVIVFYLDVKKDRFSRQNRIVMNISENDN